MEMSDIIKGLMAFMALAISGWVARSIDLMRLSVEELNTKMGILITRVDYQEKRADRHEKRLDRLEGIQYNDEQD